MMCGRVFVYSENVLLSALKCQEKKVRKAVIHAPSVVRRKRDERFSSGSSPEVPPTKSAKQTFEEF